MTRYDEPAANAVAPQLYVEALDRLDLNEEPVRDTGFPLAVTTNIGEEDTIRINIYGDLEHVEEDITHSEVVDTQHHTAATPPGSEKSEDDDRSIPALVDSSIPDLEEPHELEAGALRRYEAFSSPISWSKAYPRLSVGAEGIHHNGPSPSGQAELSKAGGSRGSADSHLRKELSPHAAVVNSRIDSISDARPTISTIQPDTIQKGPTVDTLTGLYLQDIISQGAMRHKKRSINPPTGTHSGETLARDTVPSGDSDIGGNGPSKMSEESFQERYREAYRNPDQSPEARREILSQLDKEADRLNSRAKDTDQGGSEQAGTYEEPFEVQYRRAYEEAKRAGIRTRDSVKIARLLNGDRNVYPEAGRAPVHAFRRPQNGINDPDLGHDYEPLGERRGPRNDKTRRFGPENDDWVKRAEALHNARHGGLHGDQVRDNHANNGNEPSRRRPIDNVHKVRHQQLVDNGHERRHQRRAANVNNGHKACVRAGPRQQPSDATGKPSDRHDYPLRRRDHASHRQGLPASRNASHASNTIPSQETHQEHVHDNKQKNLSRATRNERAGHYRHTGPVRGSKREETRAQEDENLFGLPVRARGQWASLEAQMGRFDGWL